MLIFTLATLIGAFALPVSGGSGAHGPGPSVAPPAPFSGCPASTGDGAVVVLPGSPDLSTGAGLIQPDDVVALFTLSGRCVGVGTWTGGPLALVAWADDPATPEADGFAEGEVVELRVYDASEQSEHSADVRAAYEPGYDPSGGLRAGQVYVVSAVPTGGPGTGDPGTGDPGTGGPGTGGPGTGGPGTGGPGTGDPGTGGPGTGDPGRPLWISEVDAFSLIPYVEISGATASSPLPDRWLSVLDGDGLVRWSLSLAEHTADADGFFMVIVDGDTSSAPGWVSTPQQIGTAGRPGALVLSSLRPVPGQPVGSAGVLGAVVFGEPGVARGDDLLGATGETVQYVEVATKALSRPDPGRMFFPAAPTPGAAGPLSVDVGGPDLNPDTYHLLSVPVLRDSGAPLSVGDLAEIGPVVGIPGSSAPLEDPNVWTGRDALGFVAPSSVDVALPPGQGLLWHWPAASGSNATDATARLSWQGWPVNDGAAGEGRTLVVSEPSEDGHYLVGNPYAYPLRIDGLAVDGGALHSALAAWDPTDRTYVDLFAEPDGADALPVWAGAIAEVSEPAGGPVTFSSTSSRVDPTAPDPLLDRDGGAPDRLSLELSGVLEGDLAVVDRSAHLRLVDGATAGWDRHDASKLTPPTSEYALVAFVGERGGEPYRQRVLSVAPGDLAPSPIAFTTTRAGTFVLRWTGGVDLEGLELVDHVSGGVVELAGVSEYAFTAAGPTAWNDRFEIRDLGSAPAPTFAESGPGAIRVGSPFPNPVASSTTVLVETAQPTDVAADVFDLVGRRVATADVRPATGGASVHVDARGFAAGLYVLRVRAGGTAVARRFAVVR